MNFSFLRKVLKEMLEFGNRARICIIFTPLTQGQFNSGEKFHMHKKQFILK